MLENSKKIKQSNTPTKKDHILTYYERDDYTPSFVSHKTWVTVTKITKIPQLKCHPFTRTWLAATEELHLLEQYIILLM